MATIGKNILENLTTGMYADSKVIYREYVQNACDQIDKAVELGIIDREQAEVFISIKEDERFISVEDNATGVKEADFVAQLGDIANSDKKVGVDKGFRGIGRLCGLAYCKTLVFSTSYKGETKGSKMVFDAKKMREMLSSPVKYTVDDIMGAIVSTETFPEEQEKHYFKVEMIDINHENTDLLDKQLVSDYLSFVAPVPYVNSFHHRDAIYEHAASLHFKIDEYNVEVNGNPLFKKYQNRLYDITNATNKVKKAYDEISSVAFKDFVDSNGQLLAWMWYGVSRFEKAIPKAANPMCGLRVRQGNIQIGDNTTVAKFFKEERGNSYFVGEIFAVSKGLIPNSQRDNFNETVERVEFETQLKKFFYDTLHKLYYMASATRNDYKKIEAYSTAVSKYQEKSQKGFIDINEKAQMEAEVEAARKRKEEAERRIARFKESGAGSEAEQRVRRAIEQKYEDQKTTQRAKDAEKAVSKVMAGGSKTKYFTDNLSKLDRSKRKLVQQIMAIIRRIVSKEVADQIQEAIEKEFR